MQEVQSVIVYGSGISGKGAAQVLAAKGYKVYLYNDSPCTLEPEVNKELAAYGGRLVIGSDNLKPLLRDAYLMVLSPGVPADAANVKLAEAAGLEVISEIELGYRFYEGHIAGITGTNGKTTTTAIVGEMFKHLAVPSAIGGNIGLAFSKETEHLPANSWIATELSSFQLEKVKDFCPDIALVLNLTPDHMERHYTMEGYAAAKKNIFRNQGPEQITVLNYDDPLVRTWAKESRAQICYFSRKSTLPQGIFMLNGNFVIKWKDTTRVVCNINDLHMFGDHNEENVLAAIACGYFAGVSVEDMAEVLRNFRTLEHRIEYVDTIKGVPYFNDSKSTNTDATTKALEAFKEGHIVLLLGGHDKLTPLESMMALVQKKADVVIIMGAAKERFYCAAKAAGINRIILVNSFEEAVEQANKVAVPPQVVLLSPACSSYDMFNNYRERGRYFKKLVKNLPR